MKHTSKITLTALLLAPLTALHAGQDLPGFPTIGKPHGKEFQSLEKLIAMTFNDWNSRIE